MNCKERVYPEWFIKELVSENDKIKAKNGSLKSTDTVKFKCSKNHLYTQKVFNHIKLSTNEHLQGCPICGNVNRGKNRLMNVSGKRTYPNWFIEELTHEEDKEKARNGTLMNKSAVTFTCEKGHVYEQKVNYHIKLSTGEQKHGCPICGKISRNKKFIKSISSKRTYPQWFIDELVNDVDKEKAKCGELSSKNEIEFICNGCRSKYKQKYIIILNYLLGKENMVALFVER